MCDECARDHRLEDMVEAGFDGTTDYDWTLDEAGTRQPVSLSARFAPGGAEREIRPLTAALMRAKGATPHSFEDAA